MKTEQDLFRDVTEAIAAVLNVKTDSINKSSKLVGDLGAESIDFLDINYELEKRVNRPIDLKEIVKSSKSDESGNFSTKQGLSVGDIVCFLKDKTV